MSSSPAPGPWLRLTALGAAAATLVAVVSGTLGPGAAHSLLSALALPPLVALVVAAWVAYRRLLAPSLVALVLFGLAALVTAPGVHVAARRARVRGDARAHCPSASAASRSPAGPWRDYVTLTKPRIMSLLLLTGACRDVRRRAGRPRRWLFAATMTGLALACGGASALNHVLDARHRPPDGRADREAAGRGGPRPAGARARVRARALGALLRAAREHGQRPHGGAGARRQPLLRPRLHALAEALDAAEHRHRRRGRRGAAARRLRGGDRESRAAGALALPDRLPLDAAALLGAGAR